MKSTHKSSKAPRARAAKHADGLPKAAHLDQCLGIEDLTSENHREIDQIC
jgi:hypothetical protein